MGKRLNIDWLINVLIVLAIVISVASIFYYFVIFRPKMDKLVLKPLPSPVVQKQEKTRQEVLKECTTKMSISLAESNPKAKLTDEWRKSLDWMIELCMKKEGFE